MMPGSCHLCHFPGPCPTPPLLRAFQRLRPSQLRSNPEGRVGGGGGQFPGPVVATPLPGDDISPSGAAGGCHQDSQVSAQPGASVSQINRLDSVAHVGTDQHWPWAVSEQMVGLSGLPVSPPSYTFLCLLQSLCSKPSILLIQTLSRH